MPSKLNPLDLLQEGLFLLLLIPQQTTEQGCLVQRASGCQGGVISVLLCLLIFGVNWGLQGLCAGMLRSDPTLGRFQRFPNLAAGGATRAVAKMWPSVSILCVLVALANARSIPYYPPLSSDLVNHINKLNTTWKVSTGTVFGEDKGMISMGLGGCGLGV